MANNCECFVEYYGSLQECEQFVCSHTTSDSHGDPCFDFRQHQERNAIGFDLKAHVCHHYENRYVAICRFWTKWSPPLTWFRNVLDSRKPGYAILNWWEKNSGQCGEMTINEDTRQIKEWIGDYQGQRGG